MGWIQRALACLALWSFATGAAAQGLDEAREPYDRGALPLAARHYEAALRAGGAQPAELAEIHLRLGIVRAAFRDEALAREEFRIARAIDPNAVTPSELPPEQARWFEEAAGPPLAIEARFEGDSIVVAASERAELVTRLRARIGPWTQTIDGARGMLRPPTREREVTIDVEALDAWGGVLAQASIALATRPTVAVPTPREVAEQEVEAAIAPTAAPSEDIASSPWLWLGIGGAIAIGVAVAITVAVLSAHPGFVVDAE